MGEGEFANRFKKIYVEEQWGNRFVGAAPRSRAAASRQGIESHQKVHKTLLGEVTGFARE